MGSPKLIFSDKFHFSAASDSGHQLLWKERGTRYSQKCFGRTMSNGRTPLHISEQGSVTSQRYYREVIPNHVHIFRGAVGSDFLFMDDNARPHRSVEAADTMQNENIIRMQGPAYSP
ncbi:transposable element Tcb2 transposase [Trichonephila clavipes]|uniref:Transposable element Tcb2 transposase n=1 Tax=Trichonephila clavipes TaxID=2585209 RepID=A0A8X6VX72_TRICX|nr:transposable element Tcb2 transposase [Trichonephila clavipes]